MCRFCRPVAKSGTTKLSYIKPNLPFFFNWLIDEFILDAIDRIDMFILSLLFPFYFFYFICKIFVRGKQLTQFDKCTDYEHTHFYRTLAFEHGREHCNAVFGEGIGHISLATPT